MATSVQITIIICVTFLAALGISIKNNNKRRDDGNEN